ncbi:MAG: formate dehydrogenase accessory sulfurtransferase FdhD [Firmicutes bacterium]|nr:formate dehydrogenase accessory sulfurtransferase FdhD [Bacillota bacterium]
MAETPGVTCTCRVVRYERGVPREVADEVPTEALVRLDVNGERAAMFSCSPADLEALGVGYLVTSGFLQTRDELLGVQVVDGCDIIIDVRLAAQAVRNPSTRDAACGWQHEMGPSPEGLAFRADDLLAAMDGLLARGEVFRRTGGAHFAAVIDPARGCEPAVFFEDIGRHNAIDKAIGGAFLKGIDLARAGLATSCRVSREAVRKAALAGLPLIASRAGPTDEAIAFADQLGLTLVGFAKGGRMNIYTHEARVGRVS